MRITCWGCRGSLPTPGQHTVKYGGNTTCFQVDGDDGSLIIIDAGSGIRALGNHLAQIEGRRKITLLITHAHWDHLMGFPFFVPAYLKRFSIKVMGRNGANYRLKEVLSHQFKAPYFPVKFRTLKASMSFDPASHASFKVGSIYVETIALNHPGGGTGYKFIENGKSFVFLTDNELCFQHREGLKREDYVRFAEGSDLLLHDAQYTVREYNRLNRSWGHSTFDDAYELGVDAGIRKLGFCHHDQERGDQELDAIEKKYARLNPAMKCFVVREKAVFKL